MKRNVKYPKIIYWKWDDSHVDTGSYREGIDDLCARSCFDMVFVCTHWCRNGLTSPQTHEAVREACRLLHERGRKLILEIDARSEKEKFCTENPHACTGIVYWMELPASAPFADFSIKRGSGADLFAGDRQAGESLLCAYCYQKTAQGYDPNSLQEMTHLCTLVRIGEEYVRVQLPEQAPENSAVFVAVVSWYHANDLASEAHKAFNQALFSAYADIPLDGAAVDELSYMTNPFFDFTPASYQKWDAHPYYSLALEIRYQKAYGRSLKLDYLNRFIGNASVPEEQTVSINCYHELIRQVTTDAERDFYCNVKSFFGKDAFVGVHPTWFAIEEIDNTPEIWKNGIDWWDVPRDYGFTDEIMLYPVRLALTHKASANVFYNMWYGEGAGFLQSFFKEIYHNARFGGRTISLSYECAFESVVQQLCKPGELEAVSRCEQQIGVLDDVQRSPAASDILIIMGIQAACNAKYNQNLHGNWDTYGSVFKRVFSLARGIWDAGYNCDLVGSYEIDGGALRINQDGTVEYGNQTFHYVIYAYPQFATENEQTFLRRLANSGIHAAVIGCINTGFFAEDTTALEKMLRDNMEWYFENPEISDLVAQFEQYSIKTNRVPCGCVLQDGSLIFTAPTVSMPSGNLLHVNFAFHEMHLQLDAKDIVYLKMAEDGSPLILEAPAIKSLHVNGKPVILNTDYRKASIRPLTIAFFGDSITEGCFETYEAPDHSWQCVMDSEAVYHAQLKKLLQAFWRNQGIDKTISIVNAGVGGNTSKEGLERIESDVLYYHPDITVVCFGLNDVHGGDKNLQAYCNCLQQIMQLLKQGNSKPVFMTPNMMCVSQTDDFTASQGLSDMQKHCQKLQRGGQMDRYIQAAKEICRQEDVPVCDCYALWKKRYNHGEDVTSLLSNHINHPTRQMHGEFAEQLLDLLIREKLV